MTTQQETHAILQCEQRRFAAFMEGDLRTLDALLAAHLTFVHSNGHLDSKSQFLEHLGAGDYQFDMIRADDVSVRVYGGIGVLTGTGQMRVQVQAPPGQLALPLHPGLSQGAGPLADRGHPPHTPGRQVTSMAQLPCWTPGGALAQDTRALQLLSLHPVFLSGCSCQSIAVLPQCLAGGERKVAAHRSNACMRRIMLNWLKMPIQLLV